MKPGDLFEVTRFRYGSLLSSVTTFPYKGRLVEIPVDNNYLLLLARFINRHGEWYVYMSSLTCDVFIAHESDMDVFRHCVRKIKV